MLCARVDAVRAERPRLKLISPETALPSARQMDAILRESHIKRITHLKRFYRLQWLIDQATFKVGSIDKLGDEDLAALLADAERARECIADGVSFEDAGLVRSCEQVTDS